MTAEYPDGYTPMTDDDHLFYLNSDASNIQMMINHERAVLARLPKPDAEPVATSCADHSAGEIGYVKFHKRVPHGAKLYAHPPKPDPAERDALVRRIDTEWLAEIIPDDLESLLRDIRAYLVGGGE